MPPRLPGRIQIEVGRCLKHRHQRGIFELELADRRPLEVELENLDPLGRDQAAEELFGQLSVQVLRIGDNDHPVEPYFRAIRQPLYLRPISGKQQKSAHRHDREDCRQSLRSVRLVLHWSSLVPIGT